jgi:hypothetical protein
MARKRMINPDFWTDPKITKLTPIERLLFIGLISNANDYGKLRGNPGIVRSKVFPTDNITNQEVEDGLNNLENNHLIQQYVINDEELILLTGWNKNQVVQHPSKIDEYPYPVDFVMKDTCNPHEGLHPKSSQDKSREVKESQSSQPKPNQADRTDSFFKKDCMDRLTKALIDQEVFTPSQSVTFMPKFCEKMGDAGLCHNNVEKCSEHIGKMLQKIQNCTTEVRNPLGYMLKTVENYIEGR